MKKVLKNSRYNKLCIYSEQNATGIVDYVANIYGDRCRFIKSADLDESIYGKIVKNLAIDLAKHYNIYFIDVLTYKITSIKSLQIISKGFIKQPFDTFHDKREYFPDNIKSTIIYPPKDVLYNTVQEFYDSVWKFTVRISQTVYNGEICWNINIILDSNNNDYIIRYVRCLSQKETLYISNLIYNNINKENDSSKIDLYDVLSIDENDNESMTKIINNIIKVHPNPYKFVNNMTKKTNINYE